MRYGRVGTLAVATRMTVSFGIAVLVVMSTDVPAPTVAPAVRLAASSAACTSSDVTCALILGGTTVPTPDQAYLDAVRDHHVGPTHPDDTIEYVAVTAPMTTWPVTGIGRIIWLVTGPQSIWGLSGPAWPDEPLWKLSGFFDPTWDQSVRGGVTDLEQAMAAHPNEALVIYGYSQGAVVANIEKQKLAEQYPEGTDAPDIDFVLSGDLNLPNGGLASRFAGPYIPILDVSFNGPAPTDTQFDTVEILQQYDGFSDFPLYPLNLVSTANALLGALYVHPYDLEPSLADPGTPPPTHTQYGDTDYYFFETEDLPLFGPLRQLGVPESVIDVVEPFAREIVELGYDRTIRPWEPTPARLIPTHDPATVAGDLVDAVGEGITNAAALIGLPAPRSIPAAATETTTPDVSDQATTTGHEATQTDQTTQQQATQTDQATTTGHEATQTDQTTKQQATQTDQTTTPTGSTIKPWKRAGRHETPRQVMRGPLGVYGKKNRGLQHTGNAGAPTTQTVTAGDEATTAGTSSPQPPSSGKSPGSTSPGGDTDGS